MKYSTFLGGNDNDQGFAVAIDKQGNTYVTGVIYSTNFPVIGSAYDSTYNNSGDAFLVKINAAGTVAFITFLGGSSYDKGASLALDSSGNIYVAGFTSSTNYPTTSGAFQSTNRGSYDMFITAIDSTGSHLVYSTYMGGNSSDYLTAVQTDTAGRLVLTGYSYSSDFPVTAGAYDTTYFRSSDIVISKLNTTGTGLIFSTYICGTAEDIANDMVLDSSGNYLVTGYTYSNDFPMVGNPFDTTYSYYEDAFVLRLHSSGSTLMNTTYLGGEATDRAAQILIDASNNIFVSGYTGSTTIPIPAGAYDASFNGVADAFIARFSSDLTQLTGATYLGGYTYDYIYGMGKDSTGNICVAGYTESSNLPVTPNAYDLSYNGGGDVFLTTLNPALTQLLFSSFLGASGTDCAYAGKMSPQGLFHITGYTQSSLFPVTADAFDTTFNSSMDIFISRVQMQDLSVSVEILPSFIQQTVVQGQVGYACLTISNKGLGNMNWILSESLSTTSSMALNYSSIAKPFDGQTDIEITGGAGILATSSTWTNLPNVLNYRSGHAMAYVDGKIYILGGYYNVDNSGDPYDIMVSPSEVYNITDNYWTAFTNKPNYTCQHAVGVINSNVYIAGGRGASMIPSKNLDILDTRTNTWSSGAKLPINISQSAGAVANSKFYVIGGTDELNDLRTCYEYNPSTNTWLRKADMPSGVALAQAVTVNGKIYVLGGKTDIGGNKTQCLEYDPIADKWTLKAPMTIPRSDFAATAVNNKIFIIGGGGNIAGQYYTSGEVYEPVLNRWKQVSANVIPNLSVARKGLAAVTDTSDGTIYISGGRDNISNYYTFQSFHPDWLDESIKGGIIPDSGFSVVSVYLDATKYDTATTARKYIIIKSNDAAKPRVYIPVTMYVNKSDSVAALSSVTVDFGDIYVGSSKDTTYRLWNSGYGTLTLGYSFISASGTILGSDSSQMNWYDYTDLTIRMTPPATGAQNGFMLLYLSTAIQTVYLNSNGIGYPDMKVTPSSYPDITVSQNTITYAIITIANTGVSALNYTLSVSLGTTTTFLSAQMVSVTDQSHPRFVIPGKSEYATDEVLVKFKAAVQSQEMASILKTISGKVLKQYPLLNLYRIKLNTGKSVTDTIAALSKYDSSIEYAEPNYRVYAHRVPNDTRYPLLWGMNNTGQTGGKVDTDIDAQEAWNIWTGDSTFIIGVIDTGVEYTHPDLKDNIYRNPAEITGNGIDDDHNGYVDDVVGWDFITEENDPVDDQHHGTHCSGSIAGYGDNSTGVVGVMWKAKIMPLKFLSASGSGGTADAIEAVLYASNMGVRITSNSWGGGSYSLALYEAISTANARGQLFIASAGNDATNIDYSNVYPCGYDLPNIISVAALDQNDKLAEFSNYGLTNVDIGAPGVHIYSSSLNSAFEYLSGTSMACPHVAGAAGLLWSLEPGLTHMDVKNRLLASVDSVASLAGNCVSGGRLNIYNALQAGQWVDMKPITGTIAAATQSVVSVAISTRMLPPGDTTFRMVIRSNDPDSNPFNLPVKLHVTGRLLDVNTTMNTGLGWIGYSTQTIIPMRYTGYGVYTVQSINLSGDYQIPNAFPVYLVHNQYSYLTLNFSPASTGNRAGQLVINPANAGYAKSTVSINGWGSIPPDINVIPTKIVKTLLQGTTTFTLVTVQNTAANSTTLDWLVKLNLQSTNEALSLKASTESDHLPYSTMDVSSWSYLPDMPIPRQAHCSALVNGKIYVIGGQNDSGLIGSVLAYDIKTQTWSTCANRTYLARNSGAIVWNGKIYVFGGSDGSNGVFIVEIYDPVTDTWSRGSPGGYADAVAVTVLDNKMYMMGGYSSSVPSKYTRVYDLVNNTWSSVANMLQSRCYAGAAAINNKIYVYGGWDGSSTVSSCEEYDPVTNTWRLKSPMNVPRHYMGYTGSAQFAFALGGSLGASSTAEYYNPGFDQWKMISPTLKNRYNSSAVFDGTKGKLYDIAGAIYPSGNRDSTAEVYSVTQWLAVSPLEGKTPASSQSIITVNFDASSLPIGDARGAVTIYSNDPDEPTKNIQIGLTITTALPPYVGFYGTPTSGYTPLTVSFLDTTENVPASWAWDFGDGGTSTTRNPSHQYASVSINTSYTVRLVVTNSYGTSTLEKSNYIRALASRPPFAGFTYSKNTGTTPLTVHFSDTSGNNPTAWSWSFGDGSTSSSQNPDHVFTTASTLSLFTVRLIASNAYGSSTSTITKPIYVYGPTPVAGFYADVTSGPLPLTVSFYDTSANYHNSMKWYFGNNVEDFGQNVKYTFRSPGDYAIKLVVSNGYAESTCIKYNYIHVYPYQTPVLPDLKLFKQQSLNNAYRMQDYFNTLGNLSTYSILSNFMGLVTLSQGTVSQAAYNQSTTGMNLYSIYGTLGASTAYSKVKFSTYKLKKFPKIGLRAGQSWDFNLREYCRNSTVAALAPSFGNASSVMVSDTAKISAVWMNQTTLRVSALATFTAGTGVFVQVIASSNANAPYGADIDKESIAVYPNLLMMGTFTNAADTAMLMLQKVDDKTALPSHYHVAGRNDMGGNYATGIWAFSFTSTNQGVKCTPISSKWLSYSKNQWYIARMRLFTTATGNMLLSQINHYKGVIPQDQHINLAGNVLFSTPTVWTWIESPLYTHETGVGYPQLIFKTGSSMSNGIGNIYLNEIQVIQAAPVLFNLTRANSRLNYPYSSFTTLSALALGWATTQTYSGSSATPKLSILNNQLRMDFTGAGTGNRQVGAKYTARSQDSAYVVYTAPGNPGYAVGMQANITRLSGTFSGYEVLLYMGCYGVMNYGDAAIVHANGQIIGNAEFGQISDGPHYLAGITRNPYHQFQFAFKNAADSLVGFDMVDFYRDLDDPNFGDSALFP